MLTDQIAFSEFAPDHLEGALALSRAAQWPHRREDWAFVLRLSRGIVALEGERVVGTAMVTPFGQEAAINLVIVDAALRGQGLGRRLMELALREVGERPCRLTATEDGMPLYRKLGFEAEGEIGQYQGVLPPTPSEAGVAWSEAAGEAAALDAEATGMDRSALIAALFRDGRVAALEGREAGFAALRPFGRGMVAGPVVAPSLAAAQRLLAFVFAAGGFVRVDTPTERGLGPWLEAQGLQRVDIAIAMRRGGPRPPPAAIRTFALASQALG